VTRAADLAETSLIRAGARRRACGRSESRPRLRRL